MPIDPATFAPLKAAAREEIARQITGEPNAQHLVAVGFGWSLALEITRQMAGGGNVGILRAAGLSSQLAKAIADACDAALAARAPPVATRPQQTGRGRHMSGRGAGAVSPL